MYALCVIMHECMHKKVRFWFSDKKDQIFQLFLLVSIIINFWK